MRFHSSVDPLIYLPNLLQRLPTVQALQLVAAARLMLLISIFCKADGIKAPRPYPHSLPVIISRLTVVMDPIPPFNLFVPQAAPIKDQAQSLLSLISMVCKA